MGERPELHPRDRRAGTGLICPTRLSPWHGWRTRRKTMRWRGRRCGVGHLRRTVPPFMPCSAFRNLSKRSSWLGDSRSGVAGAGAALFARNGESGGATLSRRLYEPTLPDAIQPNRPRCIAEFRSKGTSSKPVYLSQREHGRSTTSIGKSAWRNSAMKSAGTTFHVRVFGLQTR